MVLLLAIPDPQIPPGAPNLLHTFGAMALFFVLGLALVPGVAAGTRAFRDGFALRAAGGAAAFAALAVAAVLMARAYRAAAATSQLAALTSLTADIANVLYVAAAVVGVVIGARWWAATRY